MKTIEKLNAWLNKVLLWLGGFFLITMIFITCANIILRMVWVPIQGTFELMGLFGALVTAFALGHTQLKKGHIAVDVLVNTFSQRVQSILKIINNLICGCFFGLAAWQLAAKANVLRETGELTETLQIIYYPFTYAVSFGCLVLALVMVTDLLLQIRPGKEVEP